MPWIPGLSVYRVHIPIQVHVDIGDYVQYLSPPSSEHTWSAVSSTSDPFGEECIRPLASDAPVTSGGSEAPTYYTDQFTGECKQQ